MDGFNYSRMIAELFVWGLFAVGLWDLYVLWWCPGGVYKTVTWEVRHSYLRYLMAINIGGFLLLHFWPRH